MDANINPFDDATQYFVYNLENDRNRLNDFYVQFRGLTRSPPIGETRRLLRPDELVNVDLLYQMSRVRLKIRAYDLYIIGFCLCLINGTLYENSVHEFRKNNELRYLRDSVAMNVDSSYTNLKQSIRKFGHGTVTNAMRSLRHPPSAQPTGDYMKEQLIEFMILVCEGGRFKQIGDQFHKNFQIYKTTKLDAKFTDLINSWGRFSENARGVREGSILDNSYEKDVKLLGKKLFENPETMGVAAEQLICMKCLKATDFDRTGRVVYQRHPRVEPDEGPNPGQNPARGSAHKTTGRGSGQKAKSSVSGHEPSGSRSAQKTVGRKRPADQVVCHFEAKKFCYQIGVEVAVVYGRGPRYNQLRSFEWGVDNLVASPGRLTHMVEISRVPLKMIKYLALGEAGRMLDMGFELQIRKIVERFNMPSPGQRQTMLFSAMFPNEIQRLASDLLSSYIFLSFERVGSSTDLIIQTVAFVEDMEKHEYLKNLLYDQKANGHLGKNALTSIFVETKRSVDLLERWLRRMGFLVIAIDGGKVQTEREQALRSFKLGVTPILVAVDVASRGLDTPRVLHVIDSDLPHDIDGYVRRIRRTGLAGKFGSAITAFFQ